MATRKRSSRRGRKLNGKDKQPELVALILSVAAKDGVPDACKRFGVADRTIRRYRAKVEAGDWPEVAALLKTMRQEALERCTDLLTEAYEVALRRIIQLVPNATIDQAIKAGEMCGQMKITRDALDDEPDGDDCAGQVTP